MGPDTDNCTASIPNLFFASEVLDSSLFRVGPDSVLQLHVERTLDTVRAGDRFVAVGIHETADFTLGDFRFAEPLDTVCGVSVKEMLGIDVPDSVRLPIPPFSYRQRLTVRRLFKQAELAGGRLVAHVTTGPRFASTRCGSTSPALNW